MRDTSEEEGKGKVTITILVDKEVYEELEKKKDSLDRSRSWMANYVLRQAFGLPVKLYDGGKL